MPFFPLVSGARCKNPFFVFIVCVFVSQAQAQDLVEHEVSAQVVIDLKKTGQIYSPIVVLESPDPLYPTTAKRKRVESYIQTIYDVDEKGEAFNIRFNRSVGLNNFETLIKKRFEKWRFEPAVQNGKPVVQKNNRKTFAYSLTQLAHKFPEPPMRNKYKHTYNKMRQQLRDKDYSALQNSLDEVEQTQLIRFSESRGYRLIQASYLSRINAPLYDRIYALEHALRDMPRIEKSIMMNTRIKTNLFKLYLANEQFIMAMQQYYDIMQSQYSEGLEMELGPLLDQAESALVSGNPITTKLRVDGSRLAWHPLSRKQFSLYSDKPIPFLELRCRDFNVAASYVKNGVYQVPFEWEGCQIWIESDANAVLQINERN
jgi:hypothetical protein